MSRFKIKVCGMTRLKDVLLAYQLGADMFGMIFYKNSPRYISAAKALEIVKHISPTFNRVGVFVNESPKKILKVACQLRLDYIQLSGNEPYQHIKELHQAGFKVIKAFSVNNKEDFKNVYRSKADLILLDNSNRKHYGGTGKTFDWSFEPPRKIANLILAGGINVDNVEEGVKLFYPLVVDVNSGVEQKPGIKSTTKMKRFFKKCDEIRYGKQK